MKWCVVDADRLMDNMEAYGADVAGVLERFLGDTDLYYTCLESFLADDESESFKNLGIALDDGDYEKAFSIAHAVKGVAGNLGVTPLYADICTLVESLRSDNYTNVLEEYEAVMDGLEVLRDQL